MKQIIVNFENKSKAKNLEIDNTSFTKFPNGIKIENYKEYKSGRISENEVIFLNWDEMKKLKEFLNQFDELN